MLFTSPLIHQQLHSKIFLYKKESSRSCQPDEPKLTTLA